MLPRKLPLSPSILKKYIVTTFDAATPDHNTVQILTYAEVAARYKFFVPLSFVASFETILSQPDQTLIDITIKGHCLSIVKA